MGKFLHICVIIIKICGAYSYLAGDAINGHIQTLHNSWKTPWTELSIDHMPQFAKESMEILRYKLPQDQKKINPNEDVKITLAFNDKDFVVPLIVAYDATNRKSLNILHITFLHDEFDVLGIKYSVEYGPHIRQLDTSHPALTAFEVRFEWDNSLQADDTSRGITALFIYTVIVLICFTVAYRVSSDETPTRLISDIVSDKERNLPKESSGVDKSGQNRAQTQEHVNVRHDGIGEMSNSINSTEHGVQSGGIGKMGGLEAHSQSPFNSNSDMNNNAGVSISIRKKYVS